MKKLLELDHDDAQITECVEHKHMTFVKSDQHTWCIGKAAEVDHDENETPLPAYELMRLHLRRMSH